MPAAVPLLAVTAGAAVSAAVGGGVLGALVGAGAAFVVSTIGASVFPAKRPTAPSAALRPGDDPTAPGAGRTQSFRQPITEHQIVFGRCKVGGPIVFIHSATDDQGRADGWFYAVVVLAAHRVRAIGEVWLGDTLATDPKFAGLVRIDRHLGDPDQAANTNLIAETGGQWTADHRGRGRAYVAVRLKITAEAFPSGPPNIAALVEGADTILDPRTGATGWSDNPALCLAWYLTAPCGWKASWDDIDIPALIAAATRNGEKLYLGLQVTRQIQSDWASEADIGIVARNLDSSLLDLRLVSGFTIGLRTLGDGRGFEDTTLILGRILNNKIGLDVHCATATAWNTSVRYYGGHFACATGINPALDRFGIRLSNAPGAYNNHNRHVFDAPNFELRQLDPNVAIPFLNETNGSAIIGRALRMEACSPIVARHIAAAQDCEYEVAWANTYQVGIEYTATATRCGNAVLNRHRAPASRHLRLLGHVPNVRAAAFRHSATEIGVEGLAVVATSTTAATTLAGLSFNGLDGITATSRGLLLDAQRGLAFVVDCSQAKEFALAHWLVAGADGGRLFVRCFDAAMAVREDLAGDVLASLTTMQWNAPAKAWTGGAVMADSSLNRRMTVRLGSGVAFAQIGLCGFDGQIELEALRLYGLPEHAPALLCGTPVLPVGQRQFAAEVAWDLPSLAPGATSLLDVTVAGCRQGDLAQAALASSTRFVELDATAWTTNTVRVMARNISPSATFDLASATLSVAVTKRRIP